MIDRLMERTDPGTAVVDEQALAAVFVTAPRPPRRERRVVLRWAGYALAAVAVVGGILAVPVIVSPPVPAPAGDYPYYETQEQLEDAATAILVVDVLSEAPGSFEGIPAEVMTVKVVADAADVHPVGELLEIKEMPGEDVLAVGGRYVVFLEEYDAVPASLLNPVQGAYVVRGDGAWPQNGNEIRLDAELLQRLGIGDTRPD